MRALIAAAALVACAMPATAQTVTIHGLSGEIVEYHHAAAGTQRQTLQLTQHGIEHVYEGAPLAFILSAVGAPLGPDLRGDALAVVVLVRCADGYEVVIALADIDPDMTGRAAILADRVDGAPLGLDEGPYRLVIAGDQRPARSARMVVSIHLLRVTAPGP